MYRGYDPDTAASVYCIDYGKAVNRREAMMRPCVVCGEDFDPEDGGMQVWHSRRIGYRYICPRCWANAEEIEEG